LYVLTSLIFSVKKFLNYAGSLVKEGVTTDEIDRKVHEAMVKEGIYPTPLLYPGTLYAVQKRLWTEAIIVYVSLASVR